MFSHKQNYDGESYFFPRQRDENHPPRARRLEQHAQAETQQDGPQRAAEPRAGKTAGTLGGGSGIRRDSGSGKGLKKDEKRNVTFSSRTCFPLTAQRLSECISNLSKSLSIYFEQSVLIFINLIVMYNNSDGSPNWNGINMGV